MKKGFLVRDFWHAFIERSRSVSEDLVREKHAKSLGLKTL